MLPHLVQLLSQFAHLGSQIRNLLTLIDLIGRD
jgi:hypothetical protein